MIFYHPDCDLNFQKYGIEIPIVDDRALKVFQSLKEIDPNLHYTNLQNLPIIKIDDLQRVHNAEYLKKLFSTEQNLNNEMMTCYETKNAITNSQKMFDLILKQTAMTYLSTKNSISTGFSFYLGGGMHHAMSFGGRGFCLVNDIVIALRKLQVEKAIKSAWVIDVDAHKGDGTAELTANDSSIVTMSIHMQKGWPLDSENPNDSCFVASDLDVEIAEGEEVFYLDKLSAALLELEQKFEKPDVIIVVDGADPYEFDELESTKKMKLTKEQLLARDKMIYEFFKSRNIPQSYLMAGGYGKRSWEIYAQFLKFVRQNSSEGSEVSSR